MTSTARLGLRRVDRRLDPPQRNANSVWSARSSLEIVLGAGGQLAGRGEAAPLPGYSPDDLGAAERALSAVPATQLAALDAVGDPRRLLDAAAALVPEQQPAARFALETALLDRAAQHAGQPLWLSLASLMRSGEPVSTLDGFAEPPPVALCASLPSHDPDQAIALARSHVAAGVRCFKLKIGPWQLSAEQDAIFARLRDEFGAAVQLRADANGSLGPDHVQESLERLAAHALEFLEEPVAGVDPERFGDGPCPLALDESLQRLAPTELSRWLSQPALRVLVLKPTALGGLRACIGLARAARARGRDALVSHVFEGPIGWAACAHLALALGGTRAAGLWPLAHQVAPRPRIEGGRLLPSFEPGLGGVA